MAAETIARSYYETGGFGVLAVFGFDDAKQAEAWHTSLGLLRAGELPRRAHLGVKVAA